MQCKVRVENIEDVRISKRQLLSKGKELLKTLTDSVLPNSQEIAEEVAASVRIMEILNSAEKDCQQAQI